MNGTEEEALIDAYVDGKLSEGVQKDFEDRMDRDPRLVQDVQVHESIIEGIRDWGRQQMKHRFAELEAKLAAQELVEAPQHADEGLYGHLKWGIGLLIMLVPMIYFIIPSRDPETIFYDYYEEFPNQITVQAGAPKDSLSLYSRAFLAYEAQDYEQAVLLFEELEKISTDRIAVPFYLGMSYLANKQADRAVHLYWQLVEMEEEEHDFRLAAHWYLALALVRLGKMHEARKELNRLLDHASELPEDELHDYPSLARRLLQRL